MREISCALWGLGQGSLPPPFLISCPSHHLKCLRTPGKSIRLAHTGVPALPAFSRCFLVKPAFASFVGSSRSSLDFSRRYHPSLPPYLPSQLPSGSKHVLLPVSLVGLLTVTHQSSFVYTPFPTSAVACPCRPSTRATSTPALAKVAKPANLHLKRSEITEQNGSFNLNPLLSSSHNLVRRPGRSPFSSPLLVSFKNARHLDSSCARRSPPVGSGCCGPPGRRARYRRRQGAVHQRPACPRKPCPFTTARRGRRTLKLVTDPSAAAVRTSSPLLTRSAP
jgi:hypothetical protein